MSLSQSLAKRVLAAAAAHFNISTQDILNDSRHARLVRVRRVAAYVLRQLNASYSDIGLALNRDHTTIIHAVRAVAELIAGGDQDMLRDVWAVRASLEETKMPPPSSLEVQIQARFEALAIELRELRQQHAAAVDEITDLKTRLDSLSEVKPPVEQRKDAVEMLVPLAERPRPGTGGKVRVRAKLGTHRLAVYDAACISALPQVGEVIWVRSVHDESARDWTPALVDAVSDACWFLSVR